MSNEIAKIHISFSKRCNFGAVTFNFRLLVAREKLLCKLNLKLWHKETWLAIFEDFIWKMDICTFRQSFIFKTKFKIQYFLFLLKEITKKWFISLGRCQCNRNLTFSTTQWLGLLQRWTCAKVNWNFGFKDSFGKFPTCAA